MAHECPECGQMCYCGRDIDDCLLNLEEDVVHCTHCPYDGGDSDHDDEPYEDNPDDEEGCQFPDRCCMQGLHRRSECHTAEMLEMYYDEHEGRTR